MVETEPCPYSGNFNYLMAYHKELLILCFSVYKNEFAGPDGGNGGHGGHVMFRANGKINSLR